MPGPCQVRAKSGPLHGNSKEEYHGRNAIPSPPRNSHPPSYTPLTPRGRPLSPTKLAPNSSYDVRSPRRTSQGNSLKPPKVHVPFGSLVTIGTPAPSLPELAFEASSRTVSVLHASQAFPHAGLGGRRTRRGLRPHAPNPGCSSGIDIFKRAEPSASLLG